MIEPRNIIAAAAAAALDETGKEKKKKLYPRIKSKNRYMCLNKAGQEDSLKPTRISFFNLLLQIGMWADRGARTGISTVCLNYVRV